MADAEGATKDIRIEAKSAASVDDALSVARSFDPTSLSVAINGVWVARQDAAAAHRDLVDLTEREVSVVVDLAAGVAGATIWTNDLTATYVHENSAYSS